MSVLRTCVQCGASWEIASQFCPNDGTALPPARIDRYDLIRQIVHTGMAEVFEARHIHTQRRVAIKLISSELLHDGETAERLRREGRAASSIGDPNIVDITDFGETESGSLYLVMEWLDGHTVRELLERGSVPLDVALDIAAQTASGLRAAHGIGVIHRDIKPENLMVMEEVDGERRVKILDFGVAKVVAGATKLTRTGMLIGTPAYMSPEQARGDSVDPRSDIYSLGCVLFELIDGTPLFSAPNPIELVLMHANQEPDLRRLRRAGRSIPPALESLLVRCLAKERARRPRTMGDLQRELANIQSGLATVTDPPAVEGDELDMAETVFFRKAPPASRRPSTAPPPVAVPAETEARTDADSSVPVTHRRWPIALAGSALIGAGIAALVLWSRADGDETSRAAATLGVSQAETPAADPSAAGGSDHPSADGPASPGDAATMADAATPSAPESWSFERQHPSFRIVVTAEPRPLVPRAPIELAFELHDLRNRLSWAVTEDRLRATIEFVHFVRHDTMGVVTGKVDDRGRFHVIFSVPQAGKYHLAIRLSENGKVLGRSRIDICVGADPDGPDAASLCPRLNELSETHGPAR